MQWRSPRGTSGLSMASVSLGEATLSPVSAASSISSVAVTNRRPSAGTRLPASISTMSPGTNCSAFDLDRLAVAAHAGDVLHHLLERGQAGLGLGFAAQAQHRVEDRQDDQHDRRAHIARDDQVDHGGAQQDDLHEILVLAQEGLQARFLLLGGQIRWGRTAAAAAAPRPRSSPFAGSTFSCSATASGVIAYHFGCSPAGSAMIVFLPLLVFLWNPAERIVRLHVVALRLALGQLHLFVRHLVDTGSGSRGG